MFFFSSAALADQAAYLEQALAEKARDRMAGVDRYIAYCEPCNDTRKELVRIDNIEAAHTGYKQYWEVRVNGKGIDLAYTYIRHKGQWHNLAMLLGIRVSDVSRTIQYRVPRH